MNRVRPLPIIIAAMDSIAGTILLADASPHARRMGAAYLAQLGYAMVTASTGPEALALLASLRPPPVLVLADAGLPPWSGIELCRRIKAQPVGRDLPVLILLGALAVVPEAELAAADGVLRKPLSSAGLQAWLERAPRPPSAVLTPREMLVRAVHAATFGPPPQPSEER